MALGRARWEERRREGQAKSYRDRTGESSEKRLMGSLTVPRSPALEKDNLECPQHFGKFFSFYLSEGCPEPSQGMILCDQVSDGPGEAGGPRRSEHSCSCFQELGQEGTCPRGP